MYRLCVRSVRLGLFAVAVAALSGCTTDITGSTTTWGDARLAQTGPANLNAYTADRALVEARNHFRNNDFGYSAALYKRVVELSPDNQEGYVGLGASYDKLRRFDLSDRVYATLYNLSGATTQYYNNAGYSYMLRGDLKSALSNFRKAQKLDPENVVVTNNLKMLAKGAGEARV
ncbi:tetratricopeptide repeat protein [Breoghania sp. L-A4]|uniref:tetratricopeptide repeat protein n=1 Tax=Breoghania sp. L-A4 TaxID=2304600 RepID=UPI000E35A8A5|nr:tetratricopeptide repeat protein [Breoghania sp. L-A4]AXS41614.1 tetratricopeptide repeat protein [Breoghania sp. L-A4]